MNDNNSQYITGNLRIRIAVFAFLGLWILTGFLLTPIAEQKINEINSASQNTNVASMSEMRDVFIKYIVIPMSVFLTIQGLYFLWLGIKTLRSGIYPPPDVKMPFRTKMQTGIKAKSSAFGCLFAGLCNFFIIALVLMFIQKIFKGI